MTAEYKSDSDRPCTTYKWCGAKIKLGCIRTTIVTTQKSTDVKRFVVTSNKTLTSFWSRKFAPVLN